MRMMRVVALAAVMWLCGMGPLLAQGTVPLSTLMSSLPAASTLAGTERFMILQGGLLKYATPSQLLFGSMSGDCAMASPPSIICTKSNGNVFTGPAFANYAAKSDMQAASSPSLVTTPAQVQNHPGVAKFWARLDGKTGSICTIAASYNVSGCVRNSAGNYTLTFTTAFASANYVISGTCQAIGVSTNMLGVSSGGSFTTTTITFGCLLPSSGAATDSDLIGITGFGTQ